MKPCVYFAALLIAAPSAVFGVEPIVLTPKTLPKVATVDERFLSFNVEMVEVTGGRFWAPYKKAAETKDQQALPASAPAGLDPAAFRQRPPIDLANPRLRKLAAALAPSYMRVSGTWANSTYFHDSDAPVPATPPAGFGGVLTRQQWKGVIDFSKAVDSKIVTSFAISPGVRDANGLWTTKEAEKVMAFTKASGGSIAAIELFNEPNFASMGGAPKGYDAAAYGRDFKVFLPYVRKASPETKVLGPGSVGEGTALAGFAAMLKSQDLLTASGPGVDAFSYHFYGGVSKRCAAMGGGPALTTPEAALGQEWLSRTDKVADFYGDVRDKFEPGKALWLSETGETACGGNPWAATFLDTFRYLEQLGRLAKHGVVVVAHNTLAASDYALIDEDTLTPRPSYWGAVLWHRLMGTTVLAAESGDPGVQLYAHCLRGKAGGVALLAVNTDRKAAHEVRVPIASERYTLTARDLMGGVVELNGVALALGAGDALPPMKGAKTRAGALELAPASITFLAMPAASNAVCR